MVVVIICVTFFISLTPHTRFSPSIFNINRCQIVKRIRIIIIAQCEEQTKTHTNQ